MRQFVARGRSQLEAIAQTIVGLSPEKPWRVQLTPHRARRTNDQNDLLWAIYTEIAKGTGHTAEEIHEALKQLLLPAKRIQLGDQVLELKSTKRLDTMEFSEYVERVRAWAAQELGVVV